jgi:hypothetical protein
MRQIALAVLISVIAIGASCTGSSEPATPVESLKAYHIALRNKDITMMKLLLSEATLKLHQDEARSRGVTLDEIVLQQSLFPSDQRVMDFRNVAIEGDSATVEVKNAFEGWDKVFLVKESGAWKIDRKATEDKMVEEIQRQNDLLDETINEGRIETVDSPLPEVSPTDSVEPDASPSVPPTEPTPETQITPSEN